MRNIEIETIPYDTNEKTSIIALTIAMVAGALFLIGCLSASFKIHDIIKYGNASSFQSILTGLCMLFSIATSFVALFFNAGLYFKIQKINDTTPDPEGPLLQRKYTDFNKYKNISFVLVTIIIIQILYLSFNVILCNKC